MKNHGEFKYERPQNKQINPTGDNAGLVLAKLVAPAGYFWR